MAEPRETTPPHFPTYNVRLTVKQIQAIVALALPEDTFLSSKPLHSGQSFNNRIYFIQTKSQSSLTEPSSQTATGDFVLKVSGHYFGARKVQNEVGSLLLLGKYCSSVPVSRVVAWSEDGSIIQTLDSRTFDTRSSHEGPISADEKATQAFSKQGWILTTRLPGQVLSKLDLEGPHRDTLLKEVASHLATWRTSMPPTTSIGNLRFVEPAEHPLPTSTFNLFNTTDAIFPSFTPAGLILSHEYTPTPMLTPNSYYTHLVTDQLLHLRRSPNLEPLRHRIETRVQQLINDFPQLSFLQQQQHQHINDPDTDINSIKFTHFDLSPRNILVSPPSSVSDRPHVTGILDFEFSAFLPSDEEFVNMTIRQPDDWTPEEYDTITAELARQGHPVPHLPNRYREPVCTKTTRGTCPCDSGTFEGVCILTQVIENIAPWFIQAASHSAEELVREIDVAAEAVLSGIEELRRFMT